MGATGQGHSQSSSSPSQTVGYGPFRRARTGRGVTAMSEARAQHHGFFASGGGGEPQSTRPRRTGFGARGGGGGTHGSLWLLFVNKGQANENQQNTRARVRTRRGAEGKDEEAGEGEGGEEKVNATDRPRH